MRPERLRIIGFDLGLANTAWVALEVGRLVAKPPYLVDIQVKSAGNIQTSNDDSLDERLDILIADVGSVLYGHPKASTTVVAEQPPMGSSGNAFWMNRANGPLQVVKGIVMAAARYASLPCVFYLPRAWQGTIDVTPPPKHLPARGPYRRKWTKASVAVQVEQRVRGYELLKNEHQRDAAGVACCHIVRMAGTQLGRDGELCPVTKRGRSKAPNPSPPKEASA